MARFYGSLHGSAKTPATRCGTVRSGIEGHIRGWTIGANVVMQADGDEDLVSVFITSGSNGSGPEILVWQGTRSDYDKLREEQR